MSVAEKLITAEEFATMPSNGRPCELVRGRIVELNIPMSLHGRICMKLAVCVESFAAQHQLGRALCNDAGFVTTRSPDSVRGPDVSYFSFQRLPRGMPLRRYQDVAPNVAFEVRSPSERTAQLREKITEYFAAGVEVVVVVDPDARSVTIHRKGQTDLALGEHDILSISDQLPGLEISLQDLFSENDG